MTESCRFALDDAAYVLGALPPTERLAFERHLAGCPDCERSVREIAGLPGLLARVPVEDVESPPAADPLPDTLLPALLDHARRTERRRRWVLGLAAAAAVTAIAAASVAATVLVDDGPAPVAEPPVSTGPSAVPAQEMTPVNPGGDDVATVALTSVAWGTKLDVVCHWAGGEPEDPGYPDGAEPTYALVVRSTDGETQQVATWTGLPGQTMKVSGSTSLARDDIAAVEIQTADGRPAFELAG